ncbi:MAG: redoxin domain-containing protein [Planctomycetota bacterium]
MNTILRSLYLIILSFSAFTLRAEAVVGQAAPEFKAAGSDGKEYTQAVFKGKWTVLEWTNKDCPFVKKHYAGGHMQATQKTYAEKGVQWFSVLSSAEGKQGYMTAEPAQTHLKECGASVTALLLDPMGTMGMAYGAKCTPHMFIINPEGVVVYAGAIDSNNSASASDVEGARNHVATALDEVLAGKPITTASTKPYGCSVKYAEGAKKGPASMATSPSGLEGKPAPAFTLKDAEGVEVSLDSLKGQLVVLYFYPMDDTPGCTKESCGFRDLHEAFVKEGVVVYGVSPDDAASHQNFIKKYNFPFGLLSDPTHDMLKAYGAWGEHVIRSTVLIGADGKVLRHWSRVQDVVGHPQEVLDAVRQAAKAP